MDPTIISAFTGIIGTICGGSASFATAWVTQRTHAKREELWPSHAAIVMKSIPAMTHIEQK